MCSVLLCITHGGKHTITTRRGGSMKKLNSHGGSTEAAYAPPGPRFGTKLQLNGGRKLQPSTEADLKAERKASAGSVFLNAYDWEHDDAPELQRLLLVTGVTGA